MPQGLDLAVDKAVDKHPEDVKRRLRVGLQCLVAGDLVFPLLRSLPDADSVVVHIHAQLLDPLVGGKLLLLRLLLLFLLLFLLLRLLIFFIFWIVTVLLLFLAILILFVELSEALLHLLQFLELLRVASLVRVQLQRHLLVHLVDFVFVRIRRQTQEGQRGALLQVLQVTVHTVPPLLDLADLIVRHIHVAIVHIVVQLVRCHDNLLADAVRIQKAKSLLELGLSEQAHGLLGVRFSVLLV
mmetsp:Transcript_118603/g.253180  ORF Transcript_118603/g.253180 Transcript_118603/m.253180 type:complete len:241 (-) Transcript_118603:94-816(-)